jgi:prophage regulatory protein
MHPNLNRLHGDLCDLAGRASAISDRIHRDASLLAAVHEELLTRAKEVLEEAARSQEIPARHGEGAPRRRILRIQEVCEMVALARSLVWNLVKSGDFPAPRRLGPRAVGWRDDEIDQWIRVDACLARQRIGERRTDEDIYPLTLSPTVVLPYRCVRSHAQLQSPHANRCRKGRRALR